MQLKYEQNSPGGEVMRFPPQKLYPQGLSGAPQRSWLPAGGGGGCVGSDAGGGAAGTGSASVAPAGQVPSISARAPTSAWSAVSAQRIFTFTHMTAYEHQNSLRGGFHSAGSLSPLLRLEEAETAGPRALHDDVGLLRRPARLVGAELLRERGPEVVDVAGPHPLGPRCPGRQHGAQPDRTAPDHPDRHPRLEARAPEAVQGDGERLGDSDGVEGGARDRDEHRGRQRDELRVGTGTHAEPDRREGVLQAALLCSRPARLALTTRVEGVDGDGVPRTQPLHIGSHVLHDAGGLVAEDRAGRNDARLHQVEVGSADPARGHTYDDAAGAGLGVGNLRDLQSVLRCHGQRTQGASIEARGAGRQHDEKAKGPPTGGPFEDRMTGYASLTLAAWRPFGPWVTSNVTF